MQTLQFNTTTKSVKVTEGSLETSTVLFKYENVPTVKVLAFFYEVMQKDEFDKSTPVLRLPISNTNMVISK
jgi:hypothetical protein